MFNEFSPNNSLKFSFTLDNERISFVDGILNSIYLSYILLFRIMGFSKIYDLSFPFDQYENDARSEYF